MSDKQISAPCGGMYINSNHFKIKNKTLHLHENVTNALANEDGEVGFLTEPFRYSTEEQETSKLSWDGKPIYTKMIQFTRDPSVQVAVDLNIPDVDVIWIVEANYVIGNMNTTTLPYITLTPAGEINALICYIHQNSKKVVSEWLRNEEYTSSGTIRLIVEYTKTTDAPNMD